MSLVTTQQMRYDKTGAEKKQHMMGKKQIKKLGNYLFAGKTLGKGHFGFVELALHTITNIQVAVKITEQYEDKTSANLRRNFYREVSTLNKLNHPGIVTIHEALVTKNVFCLVMEYVDGGDLLNYVQEKEEGRLEENEARFYFEQIVSVLEYVHKRRIVHRDLKMENILLQGPTKKVIKVIDFGLSNTFSKGEFLNTKCGSPEYAAPELFQKDRKYGTEVDIWSLGIILYGMLVGELPFRNGNYGKLVGLISKGLTECHHADMKHLSAECVVLLSNILQPDPKRRYSVLNITVHSWTCEGQSAHNAVSRSTTIDPRIKHRVVSIVASLMGLTKSEVSAAVDLRKCDSLFAVYNMLLQEELTQAKCANKPVAPLNIQAHDALILNPENRINLRENTRNEEERRIHSGAISQKHRLRFSLGRRHGVFPRKQRCERALDECISISGKQVNGCLLKQSLTNGIRIRNKYGVHDADIETIEERQVDDLKNTSKGELVDQDKGITMGIIENAGTSETKADDSDHDNTNQGLLEQKVCKECIRLSNGAAVLDTQVVLGDTECTQEDQVTEFIQPTPSIDNISESQSSFQTSWINDIIGQNETEEDRRELTWAKGPFRDKINASKICTVTCVTLQNFEVKERKSVHLQRRPVYPRRHLPERKGSTLHTIPSKEIVNPSRDLEEVIEERLKPCLKNSAASLRQRPRTANTKIDGLSTKPQLPLRPKTAAICSSLDRTSDTKDWATSETRDKSLTKNSGNTAKRTLPEDNSYDGNDDGNHSNSLKANTYVSSLRARKVSRNPNNIKVDSWLDKKNECFEISGKKVQIEGRCGRSEKTEKPQKDEGKVRQTTTRQSYPYSCTTDAIVESKSSSENACCSIDVVVGNGCLTKSEKVVDSEKNKEGASNEESLGKLEDKEAFLYEWLTSVGNSEKATVSSSHEKLDSKKLEVLPVLDDNQSHLSSQNTASNQTKVSDTCEDSKNSLAKKKHKKKAESCKSEKDSPKTKPGTLTKMSRRTPIESKCETLDKLFCTGDKIHSGLTKRRPRCKHRGKETFQSLSSSSNHVFVPSGSFVTPTELLVPHPSVDRIEHVKEHVDHREHVYEHVDHREHVQEHMHHREHVQEHVHHMEHVQELENEMVNTGIINENSKQCKATKKVFPKQEDKEIGDDTTLKASSDLSHSITMGSYDSTHIETCEDSTSFKNKSQDSTNDSLENTQNKDHSVRETTKKTGAKGRRR